MRIALFCNDYWPVVGGVPTATRGLANALVARGHQVTVLTRQPGGAPSSEAADAVQILRFAWNVRPWLTFPARFVRAGGEVRRALAATAPDVVYCHFVSVHALYALRVARHSAAPLILSFRGNDALGIARSSPAHRLAYGWLTRTAAVNLFCSEWLRTEAMRESWFRGRAGFVGVLADAVSVEHRAAPPTPNESYVLASGRFVRKKGFDLLLHAWARVAGKIPAALWIAGDGPERDALHRLATGLGLGSRVRFLGAVPHEKLLGILERAVLCVVPSRSEPYGIVVVEAQALGVPVVATSVGNLPVLIEPGRTGYLVDSDADALAECLAAVFSDGQRRSVAEAARRSRAANRSYGDMAAELEEWVALARSDMLGNG